MSRQAFQVAYEGPSDTHAMDVQELAPSLLAFGKLVREANAAINGNRTTVKVLVQYDLEHRCFNINFEVVQSILHMIADFLQSAEVKTARHILIDLGIIGGGGGLGLFGYLKFKKSRAVTEVRDSNTRGVVIVQFGDGNTANVSRDAVELSKSSKIRAALEGVLAPVGTDGIKKMSFKDGDDELASISEEEAKDIISSFEVPVAPCGRAVLRSHGQRGRHQGA